MEHHGHEIIEHTADVGIRAFGETRERLFENAAFGLLTYIVEGLAPSSGSVREEPVELVAGDDEELLVAWLNDRLWRFDAREEIHAWPRLVHVGEGRLSGTSGHRRIDWAHDRFHAEVKSATYHALRLQREGSLWVAEVIYDL